MSQISVDMLAAVELVCHFIIGCGYLIKKLLIVILFKNNGNTVNVRWN